MSGAGRVQADNGIVVSCQHKKLHPDSHRKSSGHFGKILESDAAKTIKNFP